MARLKYALDQGGPRRLEVSWKGNWNEVTVRLDDNVVGMIADIEQLKEGRDFQLEDGTSLKVQLKHKSFFPFISILKDGQPLPSPGPEPAKRLGYAYKITFLIGAANILLGLIGSPFQATSLNLSVSSIWPVVIGCLFLVLGFFIMRRSMAALAIAVGIFAIDLVLAIISPPDLPRLLLVASFVFRILILFTMIQGFGAIMALRQNQAKT
jgi:hypothetical protein